MTLDEIIINAIPITVQDCNISKAKKLALRQKTKERILAWLENQLAGRNNVLTIGDFKI